MTMEEFEASLSDPQPPDGLSPALTALWLDGGGDWEAAHDCAQDDPGAEGSWVHAYLHRKEGDRSNAAYWYARAKKPMPDLPLEEEWRAMVGSLLS